MRRSTDSLPPKLYQYLLPTNGAHYVLCMIVILTVYECIVVDSICACIRIHVCLYYIYDYNDFNVRVVLYLHLFVCEPCPALFIPFPLFVWVI